MKQNIADRLTSQDLVDFLDVTVEELIDCFEDRILDNWGEILEMAGMEPIPVDNSDNSEVI